MRGSPTFPYSGRLGYFVVVVLPVSAVVSITIVNAQNPARLVCLFGSGISTPAGLQSVAGMSA